MSNELNDILKQIAALDDWQIKRISQIAELCSGIEIKTIPYDFPSSTKVMLLVSDDIANAINEHQNKGD